MAYTIGIAGGSASGKTTLIEKIRTLYHDKVTYLAYDNYYLPQDHLSYEERCLLNYDHPDAFDTDLYIEQIQELQAGHEITCPVYDYTVHTRSKEVISVSPRPIILLDGILLFEDPRLRKLMDMKIFVDTDADERFIRRLMRDTKERARSIESVIQQYTNTVKPMHNQFVEPSKQYADFIVPGGGNNPVVHATLKAYLDQILFAGQT